MSNAKVEQDTVSHRLKGRPTLLYSNPTGLGIQNILGFGKATLCRPRLFWTVPRKV